MRDPPRRRQRMPTTRAPGEAAPAEARQLIELPADALGLVLYQLPLAHDIAAVAPTYTRSTTLPRSRQAGPFSPRSSRSPGTRAGGRRSARRPHPLRLGHTVNVWRDGVRAHHPGAHRLGHGGGDAAGRRALVSGSRTAPRSCGRSTAIRAHHRGGQLVLCRGAARRRALRGRLPGEVRLHVDGTLVHALRGTPSGRAVVVMPDGEHIVSGASTSSSRCGASPPRACEHRPGTSTGSRGGGDARRPAHPQRLAGSVRVAPRRHPREHLLASAHLQ